MFLQGALSGLAFLLSLIFDFYIFVLIVRFILQKCFASYHNPITRIILKITTPVLKPLQKIIPGVKGFDLAIVVLVLLLSWIEVYLLLFLQFHAWLNVLATLVITIGTIFEKVLNLYFFAIIIGVIMSWVPSLERSPMAEIIHTIIDPLMLRMRRLVHPIAGLDFSPLILLVALKVIELVLFAPLMSWGLKLAVIAPS